MLNAILALSVLATPTGQACQSGKAEYAMPDTAYVLQTDSRAGAPVHVSVRSIATEASYEFLIMTGNGYSTDTLVPLVAGEAVDTAHDVQIYSVDDDLGFYPTFPRDAAPEYILAPELGRMLRYEAETLGGPTMASGVRENLPRGFFRFQRCLD